MLNGKSPITSNDKTNSDKENQVPDKISEKKQEINTKTENKSSVEKRKLFRKTISNATDDYSKKKFGITDPELLSKLDSLQRPISREVIIYRIKSPLFGSVIKFFLFYFR